MIDYFNNLDAIMQVYYGLAIIGGFIFFIQLIMLFFGLDFDADVAIDGSDYAFKFLSLQGLSGGFIIFGLVGALIQDKTGSIAWSLSIAIISGLLTCLALNKFMKMLLKAQSNPTLNYQNAIGLSGTVYLHIPENGVGQLQISIQGRMVYPKAVSEDKKEIKTGERVKVVKVESDNVLIVQKI